MRRTQLLGLHFLLVLPCFCEAAITITKMNDINLGLLKAGPAGRQWIVGTDGSLTGTGQADYVSGAAAGEIVVTDTSAPAMVQIQALNITSYNGFQVNQILCRYGNGSQTRCDLSGYSITTNNMSISLKVGIDVESTQYHYGGDNAGVDFDISITYQ
ncbi:hypothetical protein OPS25_15590 [Alteromonas ponticola]|uniref:DUF4402 domain-containing protein n=1 Tax=Alteromonas aquimaris TaxID=2998417 RepID=A0ABT3PAX4_9ALTE|nr:hypothetical protein [Alteromonas aquimaris]MCW8109929.1 hypothetical protein [Alteromonas aquimaris]